MACQACMSWVPSLADAAALSAQSLAFCDRHMCPPPPPPPPHRLARDVQVQGWPLRFFAQPQSPSRAAEAKLLALPHEASLRHSCVTTHAHLAASSACSMSTWRRRVSSSCRSSADVLSTAGVTVTGLQAEAPGSGVLHSAGLPLAGPACTAQALQRLLHWQAAMC